MALIAAGGSAMLFVALGGLLALTGGLRLSDPLPAMDAEGRRFVPPPGSTLLSVTRSELDRVCFLQCTTRSVTLEYEVAEPRSPELCEEVRSATERWAGEARANPSAGPNGEPLYECDFRATTASEAGWCAAAVVRLASSASDPRADLLVTVSEGC